MFKQISKKGISEILSYVLLIIIALGISVLVYGFLVSNVPKGQIPECNNEIHVIVTDYTCSFSEPEEIGLTLEIQNRGFFNTTGLFFRLSPPERSVQSVIAEEDSYQFFVTPLAPGLSREIQRDLDPSAYGGTGEGMILEIQPAYRTDEGIAICEQAVINQKIDCERPQA